MAESKYLTFDDLNTSPSPSPDQGGDNQYLTFADLQGNEGITPPPPVPEQGWGDWLRDKTSFSVGDNTFSPFDTLGAAMGALKAPINMAYRAGAHAMGLPVSDNATPEQGIGELVSGGSPTTDPWGIVANAAGNVINPLSPLMNALGPKAATVNKNLTEKAAGMAFDPASILFAAGGLPPVAHGAMQVGMGHGIVSQAAAAADEYKKNGMSGDFLSLLSGMGVDGLFMLSAHLGKDEVDKLAAKPEVQAAVSQPTVTDTGARPASMGFDPSTFPTFKAGEMSPPPEINRDEVKLVDKITKAQDAEDVKGEKNKMKPPIELDPLFPEGELKKATIDLQNQLEQEQDRYPNEERFKEAREKVKEMEGGYPEEGDEDLEDHVKLVDRIEKAQAREEIQNRKNAEKAPIKLSPDVMNPPPGEEPHIEMTDLKATLQEAVEGFTPKTSIKNLQSKLGIDEDSARDLYWKTKNALLQEKKTGTFPLDEFRDVPLEVASNLAPHMDDATATKLMANPQLQKLNRFIENVFPAAKDAARNALKGDQDYVEQNQYAGMGLKKNAAAYRRGFSTGREGESSNTGEIRFNPWMIAREAEWKESQGTIPKGSAPQEFARLIQETLGHENAHAHGPHGEKGGPRDLFTGAEQKGQFNPEAAEKNFSFQTADQSVRNSPEFNKAFEGLNHPNNAADLRKMYESILKDGKEFYQKVANESASPKKSAYNPDQNMEMKPPLQFKTKANQELEKTIQTDLNNTISQLKNNKNSPPSYDQNEKFFNEIDNIRRTHPEVSEEFIQKLVSKWHKAYQELDENMATSAPFPPPSRQPNVGNPQTQQAVQQINPSLFDKIKKGIKTVASGARTITVAGDVSSPFRQSWIQTFAHPLEAAKNIQNMPRTMSEAGYERMSGEIRQNPYFQDAIDHGLALTKGLKENKPEEQFEGAKAIEAGLKKVGLNSLNFVNPSERAYTQYLNKTRIDSFQRGMEVLEGKYGRRFVPDSAKKALAEWVNTSTGRGKFQSESWNRASAALSEVLFSPRLLKSRIDVFNPMEWARLYKAEPEVAKMAMKDIAKSAAFVGSMVAGAAAMGAKVEGDMRSPDFGKIRIGRSSIDPWGGYQQYLRYGAQLVMGERKNAYGQIKPADRGDTLRQFARSKLAPLPGFLYSAVTGKNMIGRRTNLTNWKSYVETFAPMTIRDITEVAKQDPVLAAALALPISLGMGTVTREPIDAPEKVQKEYERLLVPPPQDAQTVPLKNAPKITDPLTGKSKYQTRPLTDAEYEETKKKGDALAFHEVEKYITSPEYQRLNESDKRIALNRISRNLGKAKKSIALRYILNPPPNSGASQPSSVQ